MRPFIVTLHLRQLIPLVVTDNDGASNSTSDLITLVGAIPTEIPGNVSATDNLDGTASIEWNYTDSSATAFQIERRKLNRKGNWSGASLVATISSSSLSYTDASGKGTFAYRVIATNDAGATDPSGFTY